MQEELRGIIMPEKSSKKPTIEDLAVKAANGDDASMAALISAVMPLARAKASEFGSPRLSGEDLTQEGMLGFLDAVKSFRPEKGVPFKAYAEICINNRILSAVRANTNNKNAALSNAVSINDEGFDVQSSYSDPANIIADIYGTEALKSLIDSDLSDFEKKVIELRLLERSYAQIASELECSEKAVDNALQRIRKKIRSSL